MIASTSDTLRPAGSARWRILLVLAVLLGAGCRLAQYAADRSYWHDEACIVLNVRTRSAGELLQKLDYDQAAPPLFLLAERGMFLRFGDSEWSLRLMPTLVGIAAVGMFALLAWRLMPGAMAVAVTTLFACSDQLIARAVEVKPYGSDAAMAVLLTWLAAGITPRLSARVRLAMVALVGSAAVWFSYPAILVLAALCLALLPALRRDDRRTWWAWAAGCGLPVAISFGILFCVVIRVQQTPELHAFWQDEFVDLHRPWTWIVWIPRRLAALCDYPCQPMGPILLIGGGIGIVSMWRYRRREQLFMLIGPILMTIAAAFAQRYPLDGSRLNTFLTADVLLLGGIGMQWLVARGRGVGVVGIAAIAAMLAVSIGNAGYHLAVPRMRGNLRPIAQFVAGHRQAGDQIFPLEDKEFACYWPITDPSVHTWLRRSDRMPGQFWIVWSLNSRIRQVDPVLRWARAFATEDDHLVIDGASAFRFDTTGHPPPAAPLDPPSQINAADHHLHARPRGVFGE
jgi:hypothetical protein